LAGPFSQPDRPGFFLSLGPENRKTKIYLRFLLLPYLPLTTLPTHSVGASGSRSAASLPFVCCCLFVVLPPPVVHRRICLCLLSCLHLLPQLCLALHPSRSVGLSHFPAPQPLPLVAPPPGALASAIHYASTFCCAPLVWLVVVLPGTSTPILLQLCLMPRPPPLVDPSPVTAFGIVCCRSCRLIRPV
jgi:hypothetical protein